MRRYRKLPSHHKTSQHISFFPTSNLPRVREEKKEKERKRERRREENRTQPGDFRDKKKEINAIKLRFIS